jgi:predicted DNA-binding helix-hairpin-helix protein
LDLHRTKNVPTGFNAEVIMNSTRNNPDIRLIRSVGYVDLKKDEKVAWALQHPQLFPVDINRAPIQVLERIPGVSRRQAERILELRQKGRHLTLSDLVRVRVSLSRARSFVVTADYEPPRVRRKPRLSNSRRAASQLSLLPMLRLVK